MNRFIFRLLIFLFITSLQFSYSEAAVKEDSLAKTVFRAAIDIGSGATKLRIAEVDPLENRVKKIVLDEAFTVPYQEHLERSKDFSFDNVVKEIGLEAMKKCKEISSKYRVSKIIGVATESFRKAKNAGEFIQEIYKQTGIEVYVVDQDLEGKLAFKAVSAQMNIPDSQIIAWDIGGGSLQFTSSTPSGEYMIYRGNYASIPFKNDVIKSIQKKNPEKIASPNPMTEEEICLARFKGKKAVFDFPHDLLKKINKKDSVVVGVGSIFNYRIFPLVKKHSPYQREELVQAVKDLKNQTDLDVGGGDFASVAVTNPILILGFMEMLGIDQMEILDVNNADGSFLYQDFWK